MAIQNLKEEIANCLNEIKGGGTFCSHGAQDFVFPRLSISGLGETAYPINTIQAKAIISAAHKAPYGKGHDTIIDPNVRSAWEIDASLLQFEGTEWSGLINRVLGKVQNDLGIADYTVEAKLYKLLVYEKGNFFLTHKDTEKENNMFGTLIVCLPSTHEGGELFVRFEGEEKMVDFSKDSYTGKIAFASFYADCDHEVKPLREGYRVVLVYNLIQKSTGKKVELQSFGHHVNCLKSYFSEAEPLLSARRNPWFIYLGHQYTPSNFNSENLKLNDRAKSSAIVKAAKDAGFYASLCLITAYQTGSPLDYDDDCEEIDEVFDESITLEVWSEDDFPGLGINYIDEDDIITTFNTEDDEPFEVENSGYMGNYGPDVTHWYHYGAVAVWTPTQHKNILMQSSNETKAKWLNHYLENGTSDSDKNVARNLIDNLDFSESKGSKIDFGIVIDWIIKGNNAKKPDVKEYDLLDKYFSKIRSNKWLDLCQSFSINVLDALINKHIPFWDLKKVIKLISILHYFVKEGHYIEFVLSQSRILPKYYLQIENAISKEEIVDAATLQKIFEIEDVLPQSDQWTSSLFSLFTASNSYDYLVNVMIKAVLSTNVKTELLAKIKAEAAIRMESRVSDKPQPPVNWTRPIPNNKNTNWKILEDFMASPDMSVFDYKAVQSYRDEMERTIHIAYVDLKTEVIRKGSPYTLRITKTQRAYNDLMKVWHHDSDLLESLKAVVI